MNLKLKICGMRHNLAEVAALQPDYLGFIFYQGSPRYFSEEIPILPDKIKKVGVFVNATMEDITEKTHDYALDVVQLHGQEDANFCQQLKQTDIFISSKIELWKVFGMDNDTFDFSNLSPFETIVDKYLFDTKGPNPGGNGYTFNWDILKNYTYQTPFILSGGIGIEDITALKAFLKLGVPIYAIDVNSKFEEQPGLKEIDKLKAFMIQLEHIEEPTN